MTLTEAAGWLERRFGRRPNVASIWRWATKGIKGVRLATIALGRFRYTTESALERFVAETTRLSAAAYYDNGGRKGGVAADATTNFTNGEIVAATRRREQEKAKALEYLRSHLGTSGRNVKPEACPRRAPKGPHS